MAAPISLESTTGKANRLARRLERKGHRGPAGQLRLFAAQEELAGRGGTPSREERAAGSLADSMLTAARYRAASSDFSYEKDILPYKQAVEGVSFGVSEDPAARERFRTPYLQNLTTAGVEAMKERDAMAGLRYRDLAFETQQQALLQAKTKFQQQQDAESRVGEMGDELSRIINSTGSSTGKAKSMFTHVMKNPSFYNTQVGGSLYKSAMSAVPGFETLSPMHKIALDHATRVNSPTAVNSILNAAKVSPEIISAMTRAASDESARKTAALQNYNRQGGANINAILKVAMDSVSRSESKDATQETLVGASNNVLHAARQLGFEDPSLTTLEEVMQVEVKSDPGKAVKAVKSPALLNALQVAISQLRFYVATMGSQAQLGDLSRRSKPNPSARPRGLEGMGVPPKNP